MKVKTFRIIIITLICISILLLLALLFIFLKPKSCPVQTCPAIAKTRCINSQQTIDSRDRQVLQDPLYPPLNRSDAVTQANTTSAIRTGQLYQNPNDTLDSFHLIGYLSSTEHDRDAGGNNWKLFGRMKDRNQGDYYILPANNNIDLKIALTNDIIVGERLRDLYTIPKELRFNSPMLNHGPYQVVEIPKSDLTSPRYL